MNNKENEYRLISLVSVSLYFKWILYNLKIPFKINESIHLLHIDEKELIKCFCFEQLWFGALGFMISEILEP